MFLLDFLLCLCFVPPERLINIFPLRSLAGCYIHHLSQFLKGRSINAKPNETCLPLHFIYHRDDKHGLASLGLTFLRQALSLYLTFTPTKCRLSRCISLLLLLKWTAMFDSMGFFQGTNFNKNSTLP